MMLPSPSRPFLCHDIAARRRNEYAKARALPKQREDKDRFGETPKVRAGLALDARRRACYPDCEIPYPNLLPQGEGTEFLSHYKETALPSGETRAEAAVRAQGVAVFGRWAYPFI